MDLHSYCNPWYDDLKLAFIKAFIVGTRLDAGLGFGFDNNFHVDIIIIIIMDLQ